MSDKKNLNLPLPLGRVPVLSGVPSEWVLCKVEGSEDKDEKKDPKLVDAVSTDGKTPSPVPAVRNKIPLAISRSLGGTGKSGRLSKPIKIWLVESSPTTLTSDGATGYFGAKLFHNDYTSTSDYATYAGWFDQVRLIKVELHFDPYYAGTTAGTSQPGFIISADLDVHGTSSYTIGSSSYTNSILQRRAGPYPYKHHESVKIWTYHLNFKKGAKAADVSVGGVLWSLPGSYVNTASGAGVTGAIELAGVQATGTNRGVGALWRAFEVEFFNQVA